MILKLEDKNLGDNDAADRRVSHVFCPPCKWGRRQRPRQGELTKFITFF